MRGCIEKSVHINIKIYMHIYAVVKEIKSPLLREGTRREDKVHCRGQLPVSRRNCLICLHLIHILEYKGFTFKDLEKLSRFREFIFLKFNVKVLFILPIDVHVSL